MKMNNWFVDEFEHIGFPSRVNIDTICENVNFGLFNSGWVFTAEIVIVSHKSRLNIHPDGPEVPTYKSRMRV